MTLLKGWNHGSIGPDVYEISATSYGRPAGERGVLRLTQTSFRSEGRFEMYVRGGGETTITWKNGRTANVPLLIEADTTALDRARLELRLARSALSDAQEKLRRMPEPSLANTAPLKARVTETKASIKTLANAPASTPPVASVKAAPAPKKAPAQVKKEPGKPMLSPDDSDGDCRALTINDERTFLCEQTGLGGGIAITSIHLMRGSAKLQAHHLLRLEDTSGACRSQGTFSQKLDDVVIADTTGDGQLELALLLTVRSSHYLIEDDQDDGCGVPENMSLNFEFREARVFDLSNDAPVASEPDLSKVSDERIKAYLSDERFIPDRESEVEEILSWKADDERVWPLYQRRLSALRHARQLGDLSEDTLTLANLYEERAEYLFIELAEACEEARDYACARSAYGAALANPENGARLLGRAAWFYVTAPPPYNDAHQATRVLAQATQDGAFNGVSAMAQAERLIQQHKDESARTFLTKFLSENTSQVAQEYLNALDSGEHSLHTSPRPEVPRMMHKVPLGWRAGIPRGALTNDERLFAVELQAIEERRKGNFGAALGLYLGVLERASRTDDRIVFQLGIGRTLEASGRYAEALAVYQALAAAMPEAPDVLNRLAWFLLTTESEGLRNLEQGDAVARRAAKLTQDSDPSILDTLAEAYLARNEAERARVLLQRCVELDPTRDYYQTRLEKITALVE
ncbi:MAG: tetratricopeptide repeat protein [Bradymonadaceae bacterium]